jgi:undecaprenyl-diphosphatase
MAVADLFRGTAPDVPRPPIDPVTTVLPPGAAQAVRTFDRTVDGWFDRLRGRGVPDRILYGATELGDFSLLWHLVGTARALRGPTQEREAVRLAVALGVESVLINGVVKSFFRRSRPGADHVRPHKMRKPRSSSFPSGHATSAFMAATVLGDGAGPTERAAWYGLASVVAASRVHVKIHHPSDVVVGAAVGVGLGALVKRVWRV